MKHKRLLSVILAVVMSVPCVSMYSSGIKVAKADNPIIQNIFAPDPAPMLYNDTVYMYTTHDEDETKNGFYTMLNWHAFSTKDMVNWTSHGQIFSLDDISWANDRAWAAQCIEKDGKFYLYVPVVTSERPRVCIGVGVSDSPTGPFVDAIGAPLVDEGGGYNDIDPTVYIDDDGQAYLYFGNPELRCVLLNDDMISYDKEVGVIKMNMAPEEFGPATGNKTCSYAEGPWFYKRNGLYYMVYPAFGAEGGENISYSTSTSPTGPWEFGGVVLSPNDCFTIHPGVIDYHGRSFLFYHGNSLDRTSSFHRSCALEEIFYGEDGSIPSIEQTAEGVKSVRNLNPYERVEGETMAWERGVEVERREDGSCSLYSLHNNNYVKLKDVDFGSVGPKGVSAGVACADTDNEGTIEFRIDCDEDIESTVSNEKDIFAEGFDLHNTDVSTGEVIATIDVKQTGDGDAYENVSGTINRQITGVHDVYVVFKSSNSGELFKLDYWSFEEAPSPTAVPSPTAAPTLEPSPAPAAATPVPSGDSKPQTSVSAPSAPSRTKITSAKGGKRTMTLKWNKVSDAKGYQVQYTTDKKFKKAVKNIATKKTTVKINKLNSRKTYYVRVKAYAVDASGKKIYGRPGNVAKVRVK